VVAEEPDRRARRAILVVGIAIVAIIAVSVLLLPPLGGGDEEVDSTVVGGHPLSGKAAPEIDLVTLDGERVTLSSLRGRPVLINFWATWCPPCRDEFPLMVAAHEAHADDGFEILGVMHQDFADSTREFAKDMRATWPILDDPDDVAYDDYLVAGLPTSYFVDAEGIVRAFSLGGFSEAGLAAQLETVLP
jgi:cytochrome c biogenesis protein CcmG/thiol:disulfide interchange protein DsbE